jgi:hypothetical protein
MQKHSLSLQRLTCAVVPAVYPRLWPPRPAVSDNDETYRDFYLFTGGGLDERAVGGQALTMMWDHGHGPWSAPGFCCWLWRCGSLDSVCVPRSRYLSTYTIYLGGFVEVCSIVGTMHHSLSLY